LLRLSAVRFHQQVLNFAKEVEVKGSYGDKVWSEPTKRAKQIQAFFKEQRNGIDSMLEGLGDKTSNELINGILKFSGGEGPKSAEIFNQMLTGTLSQDLLNQIVTFLNSQGLTDAANQFKSKFAISTRPAGFIGPVAPNSVTPGEEPPTPEPTQKSKIQLLQESITRGGGLSGSIK
jgi:hypothetical protein